MDTAQTEKLKALALAAPCPWCGQSPDITNEAAFRLTDGEKYGALQCCGIGPEVRTDYKPVEHWRARAIEAWNERSAPAAGTDKDAERIDWFEKMLRERGAVWMMPSGEELRFVQVRTPGECWNGPTVSGLREAIDAAILAHTKAREGA